MQVPMSESWDILGWKRSQRVIQDKHSPWFLARSLDTKREPELFPRGMRVVRAFEGQHPGEETRGGIRARPPRGTHGKFREYGREAAFPLPPEEG